jgi:hypothetical protein
MARSAKHNRRAGSVTFRRVTRQIVGTNVRLRFDDSAGQILSVETADQDLTKEIGSNFKGGARIERSGNLQINRLATKRHNAICAFLWLVFYAASVFPRTCFLIFQCENKYLWPQRGHCQDPLTGSAPRSWNISTIRWQWRHMVG